MDFHISDYANTGRRIHFIGVCGVSMNSIAQTLAKRGCVVTGSDRSDGPVAERLRAAGIPVAIGHLPEYVRGADAIVRNAAIHDASPDIAEARRLGIPVFERPQVLGALMTEYARCICVAGTHGKSTTSSMLTALTLAADMDPTVFIGAEYPPIGGTHRLGASDVMVAEACEYCDSFLSFFPETAVILNIEEDHLDYFSGIEAIRRSFRSFALRTPETGTVIWNADDANCRLAAEDLPRRQMTFGIRSGDVRAENIRRENGYDSFDLTLHGKTLCRIENGVPGDHNVSNALAACTVMLRLGADPALFPPVLKAFRGAARRMEPRGTLNGARLFDDYAHHPSELAATLKTARAMTDGRVICVFQPHTYSRTKALFPDFVSSLKAADLAILAPIYSAREADDGTVSSRMLAEEVPGALAPGSLAEIAELLPKVAKPGDLVLSVGAGDISGLFDLLKKD